MRRANNKLIQLDVLARAGFRPPLTAVSTGFPHRACSRGSPLVRKNVSEGGWKSPSEFSPARLVDEEETCDPPPAIWQAPIKPITNTALM